MVSPYFIIYAFIAYKFVVLFVSWWIRKGAANWERRIQKFVTENDGKVIVSGGNSSSNDSSSSSSSGDKRLLFIVVPSSGAGKAMSIYDECIEVLQNRSDEKFTIEIYVTKSSDDIKSLLVEWKQRRQDIDNSAKDLTKFYGIILLSGDSSVTELIQRPLRENNDKWIYPPILHLPGGSTNLLSKEFHHDKSHTEILREFSSDKVRDGCLIKLSTTSSSSSDSSGATTTSSLSVYATHVAFHGIGRHILNTVEKQRHTSYAVFGMPALLLSVLQTIFNPPNKNESPHFALLVASTANFMGGNDTGFGMDLFDDQLVMIELKQYLGAWDYIKTAMIDAGSGTLAKQYFESPTSIPDNIQVQLGKKFQFDNHPCHFILDGTTTVDFKENSVTVESLPTKLPYFVL